ncbi:synaptonemal complex protein 2-like isoform X1 [Nerophis lumbriciformis]|uniref:synaptonemal complex protein 2-like isoform X1 n=1 Tax=Nerophis lumbriciformis TaxID=546530 RepID=UPI002ADF17F0|nr:synaptonemal complex protein 2-like isoform X1 [Nerophis lumbriciformis]
MLEAQMEDCLVHGDSPRLVCVLREEGVTHCMLTRLDQLVKKQLSGAEYGQVTVVLKSLESLTDNKDDLKMLLDLGVTAKVLLWFQTLRDLLTADPLRSSAQLVTLTLSFFDFLLLLGQSSLPVHQLAVLLLELLQMVLEQEAPYSLRLEAIRTFNITLDSVSIDQKSNVRKEQTLVQKMSQVAAAIQTAGDYDLQVSLSEALCRVTPREDRSHRANHWFSCCDISKAFCDIRDANFEADCRCFLNFLNLRHGNQRKVHTFPCLRAFLDSTELFRPKDDKLDEFWVDFNFGSQRVSFFIDMPQGFLWESIHLQREDVNEYKLGLQQDECTEGQAVLSVQLSVPILYLNTKSWRVKLLFRPELLEALEVAARMIFAVSQEKSGEKSTPETRRLYNRKKRPSQLKVLPLSSPSSDEDSFTKRPRINRASVLFDQVIHSTPSYNSVPGLLVEAMPKSFQEELDLSTATKEVSSSDRKRTPQESGYLSDGLEAVLAQQGVEPKSVEPKEWSLQEGVEPFEEEEEPLRDKAEPSLTNQQELVNVLEVDTQFHLTSSIQNAFSVFKTKLEEHYTGCWQKMESEIQSSLKDCQEHVSSLLLAVHQHRLILMQSFENSIADQLKCLEENSTNLNNMCSQILGFFQTEIKQLSDFCDQHHQRLRSLEVASTEASSSQ